MVFPPTHISEVHALPSSAPGEPSGTLVWNTPVIELQPSVVQTFPSSVLTGL